MTAESFYETVGARMLRRGRPSGRVAGRRAFLVVLPLLFVASLILILVLPADQRQLATPLLVDVNIGVGFVTILWKRDGQFPVFEVGSICVAATVIYGAFPFLGFLLAGLTFDQFSDSRLFGSDFDLIEISSFAWRYVVYLGSLAAAYVLVRGRATAASTPIEVPRPLESRLTVALLIVLLMEYGFRWWMFVTYGLNVKVSYSELSSVMVSIQRLPYWVWQVTANVLASILLVKQGLLVLLIRHWRSLQWRVVLIAWLVFELIQITIQRGGRANAFLLILSACLLYHKQVRPLKARTVLVGSCLFVGGFLFLGFLRGGSAYGPGVSAVHVFTSSNEFQSLFATAYDIYKRKELGTLGPVPWQIYFSDLYLTIPSQLLPFYKWDPAEWYLQVIGARGTGTGFMFGVMSQAVVGLDWIELVIRGTVLGSLLAALHRWYVRRATSFWPTLFYLFIATWSYYTIRATTFWILHFVVYQFLPILLSVTMIQLALSRVYGARPPASSSESRFGN